MEQVNEVKLTITKTQKSKVFLYEVFVNGQKIGQRKTDREYVAAAVYVPSTPILNNKGELWRTVKGYEVASWIGREDLILKNSDVKRGAKVARLIPTA